MSISKITRSLFFVLVVFAFLSTTAAAENVENINGLEITDEIYNNLISLGFTDDEISYMGEEAYEMNKDLQGEVVAEEKQYLKIIELSPYSLKNINELNTLGNKETIEPLVIELDEATYNKEVAEAIKGDEFVAYDIKESQPTSYKTMNTVIARLGVKNYRLKQSVIWSKMPATRAIDVTGIGINPSFWAPTPNSNYGEQRWTTYSHMYGTQSTVTNYKNSGNSWSKGPGGYSLKINLPNNDFGGGAGSKSVRTLQNYMYYDVRPIVNSNRLDVYGHYAHQEKILKASPSIGLSGVSLSLSPSTGYAYHPNTHVLKTNP